MTMTLHLADVDVLAGTLEDHQPAGAQIAVLKAANVALDAGDTVLAVRLCQTALGQGPVHPLVAANLTMVMVAAGADDAARVWQDDLLAQLSAGLTDLPADARRRISLGRLLAVLGRTEAAEAALAGALPDCPADQPGVLALSALFVKSGRPSQVVDLWQPLIAASVDRGARHLDLVKILAATGHGQVARQELAKAAPFCGHIRAEYDQIAAALTGGQAGNQAAATLNVFDRFATP